jgi:uncharacterized iron-regulated protein
MNNLIKKIKSKKIVLFGELHGTKEIPNLLLDLFTTILKKESFNLCLEIPSKYQKYFNKFMINGDEKYLKKIDFFYDKNQRDGRNSLEYYNLIKSIYNLNKTNNHKIKLFFIDVNESKEQNEREFIIFKNILKTISNEKTLIILGDVHASKNKISFGSTNIIPIGYLMKQKYGDNMINIRFECKNKSIFNTEEKEINFNRNFDEIYKIEKVTSCSFIL